MHMRRNLLTVAFFLLYQLVAAQQTVVYIGQRNFAFKDSQRNRPLLTELWYPSTEAPTNNDKTFSPFIRQFTRRNASLPAKKMPLILLSHGTWGTPDDGMAGAGPGKGRLYGGGR